MQKIIYVPPEGDINRPETCAQLSLSPPYIIGSVTGTGGVETAVLSSSVPGVNGVYVQAIRAESREIKCYVHVKGDSRADMYRNRDLLISRLAPRETPGTLYYYNDYTVRRIQAIPTGSPSFTDRIHHYNRAELTFFCPSPYWESLTEKSGYLAYLDTGFEFPFAFNQTIEFAAIANQAAIVNEGSAATPVRVSIRGPAAHPAVVNQTTGERIGLLKNLEPGESLHIGTGHGENRYVTILHPDGTKENAYHYIDPRSEFFQLVPGENLLKYESEDESQQTQINIFYRELYAGV